ncbi:MAG: hypothetical protein IJQ99_10380 [Synergistaceae bacterium]|nr:hypothetical protein [Synergistaceae bacterium]
MSLSLSKKQLDDLRTIAKIMGRDPEKLFSEIFEKFNAQKLKEIQTFVSENKQSLTPLKENMEDRNV